MAHEPSCSSWQGRDAKVATTLHLQTDCREQWTLALITLYLLFIFIQSRTPIHRVPTFRMGPSLAKQISLKTPFPAYAETCVLGDFRSRWVASEDVASQLFYQKEKFNLQKREGKERYLLM